MKKYIALGILAGLAVTAYASAATAPNPFRTMGLSPACAKRVAAAGIAYCNNESLKVEGKDRMNSCIEPGADIATGGQYDGMLEVSGTAGDADTYWYAVQIEDAAHCKYKLISEQPGRVGS